MSAEQLSTKDRVAEAMAEGLTPVQIVERLSLPHQRDQAQARVAGGMNDRPHCRAPESCVAKTPAKHCPACGLPAKWLDAGFREKRRLAFNKRLANDPELHRRHCQASAERLRQWRAQPEARPEANSRSRTNIAIANTPEAIAERTETVRRKAYAGIPRHRWAECRKLACRMPAAEAKRIIRDDEAEQARRGVKRIEAEMHAKRAREKAQAY